MRRWGLLRFLCPSDFLITVPQGTNLTKSGNFNNDVDTHFHINKFYTVSFHYRFDFTVKLYDPLQYVTLSLYFCWPKESVSQHICHCQNHSIIVIALHSPSMTRCAWIGRVSVNDSLCLRPELKSPPKCAWSAGPSAFSSCWATCGAETTSRSSSRKSSAVGFP